MNQVNIDYGQAQIASFGNAAAAGEIKYDPDIARQAAAEYQKVIIGLREIRDRLNTATNWTGFGGFPSAGELQRGFNQKAVDGVAVLDELIVGALRLQEAYFRSGNLLVEADQCNAAATQLAAQSPGPGAGV